MDRIIGVYQALTLASSPSNRSPIVLRGASSLVGEGIVLFSHHGEKCALSLNLVIAPLNFVVPAVEYLAEAFDF